MAMKNSILAWALAAAAVPVAAQHGQGHPHGHGAAASPYAGQQSHEIKALSEQELRDLLAGAGMGMAKAAELNRHPGPMHALELAGPLALTAQQREQLTALMH